MRHLFSLTLSTYRVVILSIVFSIFTTTAKLTAQRLNPDDFCYPLKNVAGYYSANFGEMRSNHFHSGVDFKTDGTEGKPVVAAADGYVSRIFCSPGGYGKALYLTHPNGTMTVYAHLQRFTPEIEEHLKSYRLRHKKNRADIYCDSTLFRFRQGEEIGRSGNSGGSYGPHLHFEIRDLKTGRTLNPVAQKVFQPKDQISPYIFRIHYVEVDTVRGVPVHSKFRTYEVEKAEDRSYRLKQKEPIEVGRNGYFVFEGSDRKDDVSNTFGIYRLRGFLDDACYFDYRMEGFRFDHTRYCNAVSCYPMQSASRNEVLRMCCLEGNRPEFYSTLKNRGILSLSPSQRATLKIVAEDDCGNTSELTVSLVGKSDEQQFRAATDTLSRVVDRRYTFRHEEDGLQVTIPAGALYESVFYRQSRSTKPLRRDTSVVVLSPVYRVLDSSIPLHKPMQISISCFVPKELQAHTTLASRNRNGRLYSLGGGWQHGLVSGAVSACGEIFVAADTVAPRITPQFRPEKRLDNSSRLRFKVSDNFSGIGSLTALVDGEWIPAEYHSIQGIVTLEPGRYLPLGESVRVLLRVSDGCGNSTQWQGCLSTR